ncbi:MAG: universal stress protein [Armatimonadota bacterium]
MYRRILVALDASSADQDILEHIERLASYCNAEVVLFRAAHYDTLDARRAEIDEGQAALDAAERRLSDAGIPVTKMLGHGEPSEAIVAAAERCNCDLIAMATHGHGKLIDVLLGSVADRVRHGTYIPVLLLKSRHWKGV